VLAVPLKSSTKKKGITHSEQKIGEQLVGEAHQRSSAGNTKNFEEKKRGKKKKGGEKREKKKSATIVRAAQEFHSFDRRDRENRFFQGELRKSKYDAKHVWT